MSYVYYFLLGKEKEHDEVDTQNSDSDSPNVESESDLTSLATPSQNATQKKQRKSRKTVSDKDELMKIVALGAELRISAYESLKHEGYIRPATEYILEEIVK